jgi:hypothetical protein
LCQCLHPVFFVHGSKKNNFFVGDLLPILWGIWNWSVCGDGSKRQALWKVGLQRGIKLRWKQHKTRFPRSPLEPSNLSFSEFFFWKEKTSWNRKLRTELRTSEFLNSIGL